jgi:hypothetical protein
MIMWKMAFSQVTILQSEDLLAVEETYDFSAFTPSLHFSGYSLIENKPLNPLLSEVYLKFGRKWSPTTYLVTLIILVEVM